MVRAPTWLALIVSMWLAASCGQDEGAGASQSDASSDVSPSDAPDESPADAGSDAPGDATPTDAADSGDSAGDASAEAASDASADGDADPPDSDAGGKLGSMSVAELAAALPAKSFFLLNVHVPYAGEIPGTDKNLDYQDVPGIAAFIGPNKAADVVLYCYSNSMAVTAGNALVAAGYTSVRYVDGGLNGWKKAGYPVEFHDY